MTVNHIRVRTMERATTLSMTSDVSVWQVSMEHIVIIVRIFFHVLIESRMRVPPSEHKDFYGRYHFYIL